jgi:cyanophycin synthetase
MNDQQALFEFGGHWKLLKGPVSGLVQPALVGKVRIRLPDQFDMAALDAAMLDFLPEPFPAEADGDSLEQSLAARAIHWGCALQRQHRIAVSETFHIEPVGDDGGVATFRVYVPYFFDQAVRIAFSWLNASLQHYLTHRKLAEADPKSGEAVRLRLSQLLSPFSIPVNSFRFLRAAEQLRIPVSPIGANLFQCGVGRNSRLLNGSFVDDTSVVGVRIARDKHGTAAILRRAGLPGPVHLRVADEAEALKAAARLGYPVVVKPNDQDQGRGVASGLTNEAAVSAAFAEARKASADILVEQHFEGSDFRLTVHENRVLQVIGRRPGGVTGDGRHTLSQLIELEAAMPENRRRERDFGRTLLSLDEEALDLAGEQGLMADSLVEKGRFVRLRRRANVSSGGTPTSVPLSEVHPDNLALAVRATGLLRLNLAGVDLITPDITRSWFETGALICEVNAQPQISITGSPEIYADILRTILGENHTIPIWAYVSQTAPAELETLTVPGLAVGASSAQEVWIDGVPVTGPWPSAFAAARALLANVALDVAVVHLTPADIIEQGLPFARCDVAMVASDALEDGEALAWLVPNVLREIILPDVAQAHSPSVRTAARSSFRPDPWSAVRELAGIPRKIVEGRPVDLPSKRTNTALSRQAGG